MPGLHVLMTNHTDLNTMELLIEQLPFLKDHFNSLLLECVPFGTNNYKALDFTAATVVTQVIDLSQVKNELGISEEHYNALQNVYTGSLSNHEKMYLKYEAAREVRARNGERYSQLNPVFCQYFYYYLNSEAMKHGFEILGVEMESYVAGTGHYQQNKDARNAALVGNIQKISQDKSRNCLMNVGAAHGVDLMRALKDTRIKNSYTHLYCDRNVIDKTTQSQLFKTELETGRFTLSEQQSYMYLSGGSRLNQAKILRERMLAMKSDVPNYHLGGRVSLSEGNSFTTMLSALSKLSFFTTIDEREYVADAVCNITNQNEKKKAEILQKSMNLGGFFRTGMGGEVFVIKNTNDPERLNLMRDSLYKI